MVFQRSIVPSSTGEDATYQSQYRIDDRVVTWEVYKNKLGTFGILVKARNFLVFQARMAGCSVAFCNLSSHLWPSQFMALGKLSMTYSSFCPWYMCSVRPVMQTQILAL